MGAVSEYKLERKQLTQVIPGRTRVAISQRKVRRTSINDLITEVMAKISLINEKISFIKSSKRELRLHSTDIREEVFSRWLERSEE
ncbi:hypothetical protein [Gloeothece citriformis]|uniref:hypothetical protein n=1 Tax=Gloeothece citriformis TaxID=2546356 RepID=UPI0012FEC4E7|nr:hypothetical protein [Gloeothece citriformis]